MTFTNTIEDGHGNVLSSTTVPIPPETLNAQTLQSRAVTALANNSTFLAIASPTPAQVLAQTKALTRQTNGIIRLLLGLLSDVSDS